MAKDIKYFILILLVVSFLTWFVYSYWDSEDTMIDLVVKTISIAPRDLSFVEDEIFRQTNEERVRVGLHKLERNDLLDELARNYSQKMIDENFYEHSDMELGENIAEVPIFYQVESCGHTFTNQAMADCFKTLWIESPGHYANIIHTDYIVTGVGIACNRDLCKGTHLFYF